MGTEEKSKKITLIFKWIDRQQKDFAYTQNICAKSLRLWPKVLS